MRFRAQRYPTRFVVTLIVDGARHQTVVSSISTSGACVQTEDDLAVGQSVALSHPDGETRGTVKWANAQKAGIAFTVPMASRTVDRIRLVANASSTYSSHGSQFSEMR